MSRSMPVRILLGAAAVIFAVACGEHVSPTSPRAPAITASKQGGKGHQVATCFIPSDYVVSARIGPKGGKLDLGHKNALVFPAGALKTETTITARVPAGTQAKVQFTPEGLTFPVPAKLTLSYSECVLPSTNVTVAYLRADTVVEVESSVSDPKGKTVTAVISHFSSYAVAY